VGRWPGWFCGDGAFEFIQRAVAALAGPEAVNRAIARDPDHPVGRGSEGGIERGGLFPNLQENILQDIFGFRAIAQDANRGPIQHRPELVVKLGQCLPVLRRDTPEQLSLDFVNCLSIHHKPVSRMPTFDRLRIGTDQPAPTTSPPSA
jgi:hypothetical protein